VIITRSREFTVNMGNYESCKIGGSVTIDTHDLVVPADSVLKGYDYAKKYANDKLADLLRADVDEAADLSGVKDTFIRSWKKAD
jgi:hypothetical protein